MTIKEIRQESANQIKHLLTSRGYDIYKVDASVFDGVTKSLEDGNQSNSNETNKLFNAIIDELLILDQSLKNIEDLYKFWLEQRLSQLRSLGRLIRDLRTVADDLVLVTDKTDGFFFSIGDDFTSLDNLDLALTTALVDTSSGAIYANRTPNIKTEDVSQIDIIPVIKFEVISDSVPESSEDLVGFELSKVYDRSIDSVWIHKVVLSTPSINPVQGILFLDFQESINANYLEIVGSNNFSTSPYQVDIIASQDGINWDLAIEKAELNGTINLPLITQNFRFLRIFLSIKDPSTYEEGKAVYQFHIKEIRFFANKYRTQSLLFTKPLQVLDESGNVAKFSSLALQTCEIFPDGTDLQCFVSFGLNNIYSTFQPIIPVNRDGGQPINVNSAITKSNSLNALDNTLKFPYNYENNTIIDFNVTSNVSLTDFKLIRDIGNWSTNSNWFTINFYLDVETELDWRTFNLYINGEFRGDIDIYPPGFYTARINSNENLNAIKTYLLTKLTAPNFIGGYLSSYIDIAEFLKIEDDNYNYFSITPTKTLTSGPYTTQHILLKRNYSNESFSVIYINANNQTLADSFKLKFDFRTNEDATLTPVLDKYTIKVNRII